MKELNPSTESILVAGITRRDGELTVQILQEYGFRCEAFASLSDLTSQLPQGASTIILAKELLEGNERAELIQRLEEQPSWSHLPIIVLTSSGDLSKDHGAGLDILEELKNCTILERPVRLRTFLSIVKAALADRKRQHQAKEVLITLEQKNFELEQFSFVASHDLQEPLRTITNYVQLLEERYSKHLDTRGKDYIRFTVEGAQRMRRLILDLLTYARSDKEPPSMQDIDLNDVFDRASNSLEMLIRDTNAEVVRLSQLPRVEGDETQLLQLFQNLIGNGIKFRKPHSAPRIAVAAEQLQDKCLLRFEDNGIGIPETDLINIFKPFHRLHAQDKYPGSGLGLSVCEKVVRRHGGKLWATSSLEKGSTFFLTLELFSTV